MSSLRAAAVSLPIVLYVAACGSAGAPVQVAVQTPGSSASVASPPPPEAHPLFRLPEDVHPLAEIVEFTVRRDQERFSGQVDIDVKLDRLRQSVWLHARGLHVSAASVTPERGAAIPATWSDVDDQGMGRLTLASPAPVGPARVHFEFDGAFVNGPRGLFKAKEGGEAYAFTQFEATDARRAFPCFDEPGFKIPFTVSLRVPKGDEAVSNTPEVGREAVDNGLQRVRFATTRPLPSYLVAFAVGPFDVVSGKELPPSAVRTRAVPIRIVAPKGRGKDAAYAAEHLGDFLARIEAYLGVGYPYPKMDAIAVPGFDVAMENAGAVTFPEGTLLLDPSTTSAEQREWFAVGAAHELAHQWFGDLVTPAWWDDAWLNESFATWMSYKIADAWDPSLKIGVDSAGWQQGAVESDSLESVPPIHRPVTSADDILSYADDTTYLKGAAVLATFERWIGPEAFQRGLQYYLTGHAHATATTADFLSGMSWIAGRDVAIPFRTFLDQPGVPFVEASLRCTDGPPRLHLAQSRYLPLGSKGDTKKTWQVPVCARYESDGKLRDACTLLTTPEADLPLEGSCPLWVMPNSLGSGYYRVSLTPDDLAKLRGRGLPLLDPRERIALGNGLRAMLSRGTVSFGDAMLMSSALANDAEPTVAADPAWLLSSAREWLFDDATLRPRLEAYVRKLYGPRLLKVGWDARPGEPETTMATRTFLLDTLADLGNDPHVRAEAKRRALMFLGLGKDKTPHRDVMAPGLWRVVLGIAGEDADAAMVDALLAALAREQDDSVRMPLLAALGRVRDPSLSSRVLGLALDAQVRPGEIYWPLLAGQAWQHQTREAAWKWLGSNWDGLMLRAGGSAFLGMTLPTLASGFCDEPHASAVAATLTPRVAKVDGATKVLARTVEGIHLCAALRGAAEADARKFFATH